MRSLTLPSPGVTGFHRAKSDSQLPHLATIGSQSTSESEDTKPVVVAEDLEEVLRQSMPKTPPAHRNSFAEGEQRTPFRHSKSAHQVSSQSSQQKVRSVHRTLQKVGLCMWAQAWSGKKLPAE